MGEAHQSTVGGLTLVGRALCGTWRDMGRGRLSGRRGRDCSVETYEASVRRDWELSGRGRRRRRGRRGSPGGIYK